MTGLGPVHLFKLLLAPISCQCRTLQFEGLQVETLLIITYVFTVNVKGGYSLEKC